MDKRMEANRKVKIKVARALVKLMEKQSFSDITITQIVETAGVARASYYRNFNSKEEILIKVTDDIMAEYKERSGHLEQGYFSYDSILLAFRYFKTYKKFILGVYRAGLASIYLDMLDQHAEEMAGDMPFNDINRYRIYAYSGAMYNVFLKWLENGMMERPEEMAELFFEMAAPGIGAYTVCFENTKK